MKALKPLLKKITLTTSLLFTLSPLTALANRHIHHHVNGETIYSLTPKENQFNLYIDGSHQGTFSRKELLQFGFPSEILDQLNPTALLEFKNHPEDDVAMINFTHPDVMAPSSAFTQVGELSPHENYGGNHDQFLMLLRDYSDLAKRSGIFPSVMIGQAMLESGQDGGSGLALTNKNLFGIKGEYNGQGSTWSTMEDYGGMVQVNDKFRAYPTYKESVMDYLRLLTEVDRYASVPGQPTPEAQVQAIRDSGYATDSSYVQKVIDIINKYNLKQYD